MHTRAGWTEISREGGQLKVVFAEVEQYYGFVQLVLLYHLASMTVCTDDEVTRESFP